MQAQRKESPSSEFHLRTRPSSVYIHPMNSQIGQKAVLAIGRIIKESIKINLSWKWRYQDGRDGIESAVAFLQFFRNKSHVSLSPWRVVSYPWRVILISFPEKWGRHHITSRRTNTAYLAVRPDYNSCFKDKQPSQTHHWKVQSNECVFWRPPWKHWV